MGAVESLDANYNGRRDYSANSRTSKKFLGSWRSPTKKYHQYTDYGNGPSICVEPLKDLKLEKSIDADLAAAFDEVGHVFPSPICSQEQLMNLLKALRSQGYSFRGQDHQICARIWSMHHCSGGLSDIDVLQLRRWFQAEVVTTQSNLRVILNRSRYVSTFLKNVDTTLEVAKDKLGYIADVLSNLRTHLEEDPAYLIARKPSKETLEGKVRYVVSERGEVLIENTQALLMELLVQLYCDHFNASMEASTVPTAEKAKRTVHMKTNVASFHLHSQPTRGPAPLHVSSWHYEGIMQKQKQQKYRLQHGLPTVRSGLESWRRLSESLPVGEALDDPQSQEPLPQVTVV